MAAAFGGLLSLPSWAQHWTPESVAGSPLLSALEESTLADLAETIIPETDIPGAKSLGVPAYIQKIVNDCMDTKAQETLKNGLYTVSDLAQKSSGGKTFSGMDTNQRLNFLNQLNAGADEETKDFFKLVKSLTIRGFTTSEYFQTNINHYQLVPGFYHGCVPVSTGK